MKLVILDRDGVINQDSDTYIKSPEEWLPIDGSIEAIARLHESGFTVAVATNQSGVARGLFDLYTLARIHQKMCGLVEETGGVIDGVFFCPHGPDEGCPCRKPKPGLLAQIASEFEVSLLGLPFVGDSLKDIQAARNAGCRPILVLTGKGKQTLETSDPAELSGVTVMADLREAVTHLLGQTQE